MIPATGAFVGAGIGYFNDRQILLTSVVAAIFFGSLSLFSTYYGNKTAFALGGALFGCYRAYIHDSNLKEKVQAVAVWTICSLLIRSICHSFIKT